MAQFLLERVSHWTLRVEIRNAINYFSAADHGSGVFGHCEDWQD